MNPSLGIALTLGLASILSHASDFRIWTSRQGSTFEAKLAAYRDGTVRLANKENRTIDMAANDLSLADRQYLIANADADAEVLLAGDTTIPELDYRKPQDPIRVLEDTITFADNEDLTFALHETDHYLFAVGRKVKVNGIAETAEACWHGMAFQHYEFRENWGDTRQLIVIPGEKELYEALGASQAELLREHGKEDAAYLTDLTWNRLSSGKMALTPAMADAFNVKREALVYNLPDLKRFRRDFDSFQTNSLTRALFASQAGPLTTAKKEGYFALSIGHGYFKEIQLTKKSATNLLATDYEEIETVSGFDDGTGWARHLKKLVKKEEVELSLDLILAIKNTNELTPNTLVSMYSLSCYMQSTQKQLASYATLLRDINNSAKLPDSAGIAKVFGFDSTADFELAWTEFVLSKSFK
ncbi:MAG: hypothetical protein ACQCXQ_14920 [Verrucomicrobiales bacterium]|nr:hypothetical protein [Verrucomicrobiota bacterium JB025]